MTAATVVDIGTIPAPPGVAFGLHDGMSSTQQIIVAVSSISCFFATVFMLLRLYTSAFITRKFELDDPLILVAWFATLAYFLATVLAFPYGWGRHIWETTSEQLVHFYTCLRVIAMTYLFQPMLVKLAMLALYHRMNPSRLFKKAVCCVGVFVCMYTVCFVVLYCGPCDPDRDGNTCLNAITIVHAAINILTDLVVLTMPIPMVYSLRIPLRQKIYVGGVLAIGSGAITASIVRVTYIDTIMTEKDFPYLYSRVGIWSIIELNLGILCNSLARVQPFIKRYFPKLLLSHRRPQDMEGRGQEVTTIGGGNRTVWWRGAAGSAYRNDYRCYGIRSNSILEEEPYDGIHSEDGTRPHDVVDHRECPTHVEVECSKIACGSLDSIEVVGPSGKDTVSI